MKPPIASPHEEDKPVAPVTRRVEWDEERERFVFRYSSGFRGRLRCEVYFGLRTPSAFLGVTLGLPLCVLLLALAELVQRYKKPNEFSVFAWGIEDAATETSYRTEWEKVKRVSVHKGDFFMRRASFSMPGCYLCRENFADENEALRLQQITELLQSQNGANWEAVKHQFQSEQGGLLQL